MSFVATDAVQMQARWLRRLHEACSDRGRDFALGDFFAALATEELLALEQAAWAAHEGAPVRRLIAVLVAQIVRAEMGEEAGVDDVVAEIVTFPVKCSQAALARRGLLELFERAVCGPTLPRCAPCGAALDMPGVAIAPRQRH